MHEFSKISSALEIHFFKKYPSGKKRIVVMKNIRYRPVWELCMLSILFLQSAGSEEIREQVERLQIIGKTDAFFSDVVTFTLSVKGFFQNNGMDSDNIASLSDTELSRQHLAGNRVVTHIKETPILNLLLDNFCIKGKIDSKQKEIEELQGRENWFYCTGE